MAPLVLSSTLGCGGGAASTSAPPPPPATTIAQIQVTGKPVIVFDHSKDQQQPLNIPDEQITAWREADGTVNLMIPHYEAYGCGGLTYYTWPLTPTKSTAARKAGVKLRRICTTIITGCQDRTVWMARLSTRWHTQNGMPDCSTETVTRPARTVYQQPRIAGLIPSTLSCPPMEAPPGG